MYFAPVFAWPVSRSRWINEPPRHKLSVPCNVFVTKGSTEFRRTQYSKKEPPSANIFIDGMLMIFLDKCPNFRWRGHIKLKCESLYMCFYHLRILWKLPRNFVDTFNVYEETSRNFTENKNCHLCVVGFVTRKLERQREKNVALCLCSCVSRFHSLFLPEF